MSEGSLDKETAEWYGKLQDKSVPIVDAVMLHTYNKKTKKTLVTGEYEKCMLEGWLERANREHSSECLSFEIKEVGA